MEAIQQWRRQWVIKIYKFFTLNRDEYPYHKSAEINEIKNSSNVSNNEAEILCMYPAVQVVSILISAGDL